jgi:hypothetical protein
MIKQIVDSNRVPIQGLFRSNHNAIMVDNKDEYLKYKAEKERVLEFERMKSKMETVEAKLDKLTSVLEKLEGFLDGR